MLRVLVSAVVLAVLAPAAHAGRGASLVKYLPDDSAGVIVVDVAKARRSPFFKKMFEAARSKVEALDTIASAAPVDKLVDTIVAGGDNANQHAVAVLEGRVDKVLVEVKKQSTKEDTHDGVTFWTLPDGEIALIDKRLVLTTAGEMTHAIDRAHDKKAKGPASVRMILGQMTAGANVFAGGVVDAEQRKSASAELGAEPLWAAVSVTLATKMTMEARIKLADEASAAKLTKTINDQLGAPGEEGAFRGRLEAMVGKGFSDSIVVVQDHTLTKGSAAMTTGELDQVLSLAKLFM